MKIVRYERVRDTGTGQHRPLWLVSFTDLVMLMLAYFILLYAVSQPREKPWQEAMHSLHTRFGGEQSMTHVTGASGSANVGKTWESDDEAPGLNVNYLASLLAKSLAAVPDLEDVKIYPQADSVIISMPPESFFSSGSVTLSDPAAKMFKEVMPVLSSVPNGLSIVGYSGGSDDNVPVGWSQLGMAMQRAMAVRNLLQQQGYKGNIIIAGRMTSDADLLPKNLPEAMRNGMMRRVDLRLRLNQF